MYDDIPVYTYTTFMYTPVVYLTTCKKLVLVQLYYLYTHLQPKFLPYCVFDAWFRPRSVPWL